MPSAVTQSLPIDLWQYQSHRKQFNGNPYIVFHTQIIRASPGDSSQTDKKQKCQGNQRYVYKPQKAHPRNQRKSKTIPRTKTIPLTTTKTIPLPTGISDSKLSGSAKADSYMHVSSDLCNGSYAVDSFVAPDPSQLPFPPLEWLQFSSKQTRLPVDINMTLQSVLCCPIAA